jgi:hypothetical protein
VISATIEKFAASDIYEPFKEKAKGFITGAQAV